MPTYVVRVWLPDRPGALGAVASRIGAVRGDLVGIDILERGAGRAIDELVVELPEEDLVALLVKELHEVDGVDVEDVRTISRARHDPRLVALETAADVIAQRSRADVLTALAAGAAREFEAAWASVVDTSAASVAASAGDAPPSSWVIAFAAGAASAGGASRGASGEIGDVALVGFTTAPLALVVGRPGRPLRAVERRQLTAVATIADVRWNELAD